MKNINFSKNNEMRDLYKLIAEMGINELADIRKNLGMSLIKAFSEVKYSHCSIHSSLSKEAIKQLMELQKYTKEIQNQHVFDETKHFFEVQRYNYAINNIKSVINEIDWQWIADLKTKCDEIHDSAAEVSKPQLTEEDRKQVYEDAIEVLQYPEQIKEGFEHKYAEWKERHPFLTDFFFQVFIVLICSILPCFIQSQPATTKSAANIYESPVSNSTIVYSTTINQTVNIVDEAPYYYNVTLVDPQTGVEYQGFIYKANVSIDFQMDEDNEHSDTLTRPEVYESEPTYIDNGIPMNTHRSMR